MATTLETELKTQLKALLDGGQAHAKLDDAVKDMPFEKQGVVPDGLPYSAWQLLEHIRIAQRDILDFSDNAGGSYRELEWPKEYWPEDAAPPDEAAWEKSVAELKKDRAAFEKLLAERDLTEAFRWGDGKQNLLREALLIADHESYHTGELIVTRRLVGGVDTEKGARMNEPEVMARMLAAKTIAVVGLSEDVSKPSHYVSAYLQSQGKRILPVNPAVESVLGEKAYASLCELPEKPDVVNVFRLPKAIPAIVDEMIALGLKDVWVQQGIRNLGAAATAEAHGMGVVMDRCIMVEHRMRSR